MSDDSILVCNIFTGKTYRATKEVSHPAGVEVIMYRLDTNEAFMSSEFWARFVQLPTVQEMVTK